MGSELVKIWTIILILYLCSLTKQQDGFVERRDPVKYSKEVSLYDGGDQLRFHTDDFSSRNLAVVNSSLWTFPNVSICRRLPAFTIFHVPNLDSLQNYLYRVNQILLECQGVEWKPTILLIVSAADLTTPTPARLFNDMLRNTSSSKISNVDINSEVFVVFQRLESTPETYEIYTAKGHLFVKAVSIKFQGLEIEVPSSVIERRRDLEGILINGMTQDDPTLELFATFHDVNGVTKFHNGVSVVYFSLIAEGLNFSPGAVRGTGWITQAPNGTLLGMAKQLQSGEADILIAFSELLPYRLKVLRFIHPYYRGVIRAFFQQPPPSEIRNIFFQPLESKLWASLLALWVFIVISLKYIYKVKLKYIILQGSKSIIPYPHTDTMVAEDAFMWGISSACGQGWYMLPECGVMKLIMFSGLITYILSFTAYSAAIVTTLSVFLEPIKTWSDLTNSGFKIYDDSLLQSSASITNKSSRPSLLLPNKQTTIEVTQALKRFSTNEPIAFISVADQFYQISSKSNFTTEFICQRVSQVPVEGAAAVKGGMIITKNSPFKKLFNYQTILIQERGLDARLASHYSSQYKPNCFQKQNNFDTYTLGINDVFTAFAILASAFVASTFLLLWERTECTHKCWFRTQKIPVCPNVYMSLVESVKRSWPSCHSLSVKGPTT